MLTTFVTTVETKNISATVITLRYETMKKLTPLFLLLFTALLSHSQTTFQRTYGTAGYERGYSVKQTSDGGYIVCGQIVTPPSDSGVYLIRLDTTGNILWNKIYTVSQSSTNDGSAVKETFDGGFIIAGYSYSYIDSTYNIHLIKTDAAGDTMWTKIIGGTGQETAYSVIQIADSGYVLTGSTSSFGAGEADVYLVRTNVSGNILWAKTYGAAGNEQGYDVSQTSDGGFIIIGYTDNAETSPNRAYLIKTNAAGALTWAKNIYESSIGSAASYGYSVVQTSDGGYVFAGVSRLSHVYLVKINSTGNLVWSRTLGGTTLDYGYCIEQTGTGGFIVAGFTQSFGTNGSVYLIKTDGAGVPFWSRVIGGTSVEDARSVALTSDGGYIITGYTSTFGFGGGDVYVIKTDSMGSNGCNEIIHTTTIVTPASVSTSIATNVGAGFGILSYPLTISSNASVMPLCNVGFEEEALPQAGDGILIYPNPATDKLSITGYQSSINAVAIYDITGRKVFEKMQMHGVGSVSVNILNLDPGIYLVTVTDAAGKKVSRKIVKM